MQNKKGRTITFRVDDEVAEGSTGNAGNDCANYYQTVIKGWKSASRWAGCLPRGLLLWVGKPGYDKKTPHLEALGNRLNRKIGVLSGLITGVE